MTPCFPTPCLLRAVPIAAKGKQRKGTQLFLREVREDRRKEPLEAY